MTDPGIRPYPEETAACLAQAGKRRDSWRKCVPGASRRVRRGRRAYSPEGIPMHGKILASALLVAALAWSNASRAEGALAVGIPDGNPARGFKWDVRVNTQDAATLVLDDCHHAKNPRTGAACKLIESFDDKCVAVTSNGE